jgi:tetratricopeptide (TPR) repeat protein
MQVARTLLQQGRREAAFNNYLQAARAAGQERRPTLQQQALRAACGICANDPRLHYEVGLYFVEERRGEEALAHFKQAVAFSNTWFEGNLALARLAIDQGEYDAALVALREADRTRSERPEALWLLAQLYDRNLNLTNQAIQVYQGFAQRFANDQRSREAQARIRELTAQGKAGVAAPVSPADEPPSFWQRMFRLKPTPAPAH